MSATFGVEVTCPRCGGPLDVQAHGRPSDGGRHLTAVVRCGATGCWRQWLWTQTLRTLKGDELEGAA
jgi:hypothetical protein